jgi:hypothetical protein
MPKPSSEESALQSSGEDEELKIILKTLFV